MKTKRETLTVLGRGVYELEKRLENTGENRQYLTDTYSEWAEYAYDDTTEAVVVDGETREYCYGPSREYLYRIVYNGHCMPSDLEVWKRVLDLFYHEDQAIEDLEALIDADDTETAHREADRVLCRKLDELGYTRIVDVYKRVGKWYS